MMRLRLVRGADIASWPADAVVSSSNSALAPNNNPLFRRFAGRDGTNGAIHAAAGPELLEACRVFGDVDLQRIGRPNKLNRRGRSNTRCAVGEAVATPAFGALKCTHVIHTVAPDGLLGQDEESRGLLRRTYESVLSQCVRLGVGAVAVPALGCGVHRWSPDSAAEIALRAFAAHARGGSEHPQRVDMCLRDDEVWSAFQRAAEEIFGTREGGRSGCSAERADVEVGLGEGRGGEGAHEVIVWTLGPAGRRSDGAKL